MWGKPGRSLEAFLYFEQGLTWRLFMQDQKLERYLK